MCIQWCSSFQIIINHLQLISQVAIVCAVFIVCVLFLAVMIHFSLIGFTDCHELLQAGRTQSGVYTINPDGKNEFEVFCDQKTNGGGWVVFQKRFHGLVDFFRDWASYRVGFGNLTGEFWLGLDKIHRLTSLKRTILLVNLGDFNGASAHAMYDRFQVSSEENLFELHDLGKYSGI